MRNGLDGHRVRREERVFFGLVLFVIVAAIIVVFFFLGDHSTLSLVLPSVAKQWDRSARHTAENSAATSVVTAANGWRAHPTYFT